MTGLTFPVLFLAIGGSVDYARATSNQTKVQLAMDSAVLALTQDDSGTVDVQVEGEQILRSFLINGDIDVELADIEFSQTGQMISGSADVQTRTLFLTLIGKSSMVGKARASAIPPTRQPIEIALVLDVSGSMATDLNGQPRIEHMKTAVNQMFDTLNNELPSGTRLSASLIPYSSSVNLTNYRSALRSGSMGGQNNPITADVWAAERLVASNGTNFALSDNPPQGNGIPFVLEDEMSSAQPLERMVALSEDIGTIRTTVNDLTPNGWTAGHLGMAWGFYSLSPSWRTFWPTAPARLGESEKIIVLLSDGEFNTTYNIGDSVDLYSDPSTLTPEALETQNDNQLEADAYFQDVCSLARQQGTTIYAVALNLNADSAAKLEACAGSNGRVYSADTASELEEAFTNIALRLTQRRLTM